MNRFFVFKKKYSSTLLTYFVLYDKLVRVSVKDNRGWLKPGEESPSSIGQDAG